MLISKAIEILNLSVKPHTSLLPPDNQDAIQLGIEALKRLHSIRIHPGAPVYGPLPGESMPERGIG